MSDQFGEAELPRNAGQLEQESSGTSDESLAELDQLVWALLDDTISTDGFAKLEERLLVDEQARNVYLRCVELHADLLSFYDDAPSRGGTAVGVKLPGACLEGLSASDQSYLDSCSGS